MHLKRKLYGSDTSVPSIKLQDVNNRLRDDYNKGFIVTICIISSNMTFEDLQSCQFSLEFPYLENKNSTA